MGRHCDIAMYADGNGEHKTLSDSIVASTKMDSLYAVVNIL